MYLFQSERLGFGAWKDSDIAPFVEMNQDPDVMKFFPSILTSASSKELVHLLRKHYDEHGFTFYSVYKLKNQEFIGFVGLAWTPYETDFTPCVEIGWRLKKSAWNQGYATEGAKRCLELAQNELGLSAVYSFTASINKPSERVMQKIGMTKQGYFFHPKVDTKDVLSNHVLYKVDLG